MSRHIAFIIASCLALCPIAAQQRDTIAGIPVNYDGNLAGDYKATLPDPFILENGRRVHTPRQWEKKRRPEILGTFTREQFGRMPASLPSIRYDVQEDTGLGGTARRIQVRMHIGAGADSPYADVLVYLPKDCPGPVPVLLNLSFTPNNISVQDEGIWPGRSWDKDKQGWVTNDHPRSPAPEMLLNPYIEAFLEAGIGFATVHYTDFQPDAPNTAKYGVQGLYLGQHEVEPAYGEWGSIAAWAWGASRVLDWFVTCPAIDGSRVAITGFSRLGKTAVWAAAVDERFAAVIPACSGEGGVGISRRDYGETVAHLTAAGRYPYWFTERYSYWGDKVESMPMDGHMLAALIAPRPMFLSAGSTDRWSDSYGDFLSALEASKVYEFLGVEGLAADELPPLDTPVLSRLGFIMHDGPHAVPAQDWAAFLEFLKIWL